MGSFKRSCLTNWDKILKFTSFENGGTDIQRNILHMEDLVNFFTAVD